MPNTTLPLEKRQRAPKQVVNKLAPIKPTGDGYGNAGVWTRGDVPPGMVPGTKKTWREHNIETYGYGSPQEHYIYGPPDRTPSDIARLWNLNPELVCTWAREDKWRQAREAYRADKPIEQGGYQETAVMATLKEEWSRQKIAIADELLETLLEEWRKGITESTSPATGEAMPRKMNFSDRKIGVSAIREAAEMKDVALGLPSKYAGLPAGTTINNNQITATVIASPSDSRVPPPPRALPESEIIEIEIIEGETDGTQRQELAAE